MIQVLITDSMNYLISNRSLIHIKSFEVIFESCLLNRIS